MLKISYKSFLLTLSILMSTTLPFSGYSLDRQEEILSEIESSRGNPSRLKELLPIVHCCFDQTQYEKILMTQLRDVKTSTKEFRELSRKIGEVLIGKVVECLPTQEIEINTPVAPFTGLQLQGSVELVSVMRSGDILLDTFLEHFPDAHVSKFLIQRDEETALPQFIYMKASPTLTADKPVIITEPMVATGGTLEMVITLLKEKGVKENNIIIACVCAAPEGLLYLSERFPDVQVVMTALDEKLNHKKYIVPGLGDFGDRFFGTPH